MHTNIRVNRSMTILYFFIAIGNMLLLQVAYDEVSCYIYCWITVLLYLCTTIISIRKIGAIEFESIILYLMFLFSLSPVFAMAFGVYDIREGIRGYLYTKLTSQQACEIVSSYNVFLCLYGIILVFPKRISILYKKDNDNHITLESIKGEIIKRIFKPVFWISFPIAAFAYFFEYITQRGAGYASQFIRGSIGLSLFSGIKTIFLVSFFFICSTDPDEKDFNRIGLAFISTGILNALKGSRIYMIGPIVFFLWYRSHYYNKKIKIWTILPIAILLIPIMFFLMQWRQGVTADFGSIGDIYYDFIFENASATNIFSYYVANKESIRSISYPFVFDGLMILPLVFLNPSVVAAHSEEVLRIRSSLDHYISYNISHSYYLLGGGVGSNPIAEAYEFGILGVFVFSVVLLLMIRFLIVNSNRNRFVKFMSYEMCTYFVFLLRSSMFYNSYQLVKYTLIYLVVTQIVKTVAIRRRAR